jgi:hypothetical protein
VVGIRYGADDLAGGHAENDLQRGTGAVTEIDSRINALLSGEDDRFHVAAGRGEEIDAIRSGLDVF